MLDCLTTTDPLSSSSVLELTKMLDCNAAAQLIKRIKRVRIVQRSRHTNETRRMISTAIV